MTTTSTPITSTAVRALDDSLNEDLEALRRDGLFRPLRVLESAQGPQVDIGGRRTAGGQRIVDGAALAQLAVQQASAPEPSAIVGQSARNRFTGIVTRVVKDKVAAQVEIQAGPHRVVSLMTREAADELGLEPGTLAVAAVKATNVVIAVPGE